MDWIYLLTLDPNSVGIIDATDGCCKLSCRLHNSLVPTYFPLETNKLNFEYRWESCLLKVKLWPFQIHFTHLLKYNHCGNVQRFPLTLAWHTLRCHREHLEFKSQLCHSLALGPWASQLIFLCLCFLICKNRRILLIVSIKWDIRCQVLRTLPAT